MRSFQSLYHAEVSSKERIDPKDCDLKLSPGIPTILFQTQYKINGEVNGKKENWRSLTNSEAKYGELGLPT